MNQSFSDLAFQRRSCHHFRGGFSLSDESFFEILETVRFTPSGYNAQPWEFLLIRDEKRLKEVYELAFEQEHILTAGNIVIVLGNTQFGTDECERICQQWTSERNFSQKQVEALRASLLKDRPLEQKREMVIRNVALAAMTFMYTAEEKGFITCPMMGFSQKKLAKLLQLPEKIIPIMMITIGKPGGEEEKPLERKKAKEIGFVGEYKK